MLNLAKRIVPAITITAGTTLQCQESSGANKKYKYAGATPKLTTSANESICLPNSLVTPNARATKPSSPSNIKLHTNNIGLQ